MKPISPTQNQIYPVAVSIRSTNVYEERSLGVFEAPPDDEEEDPEIGDLTKVKSRKERVGRYVSWHVRKQMSIGEWPRSTLPLRHGRLNCVYRHLVACLGCLPGLCHGARQPNGRG